MEFQVYNAITEQKLNFKIEKGSTDERVMNVIYAANGIGKSSLANILSAALDDQGKSVVHYMTKEQSSVKILTGKKNIQNIFKYDRDYVDNSVALYKQKLIVAPRESTKYVALKQANDEYIKDFINKYNSGTSTVTNELIKNKNLLKNTRLQFFDVKNLNYNNETMQNRVNNIIFQLSDFKTVKLDAKDLKNIDLIEISYYLNDEFINEINTIKEIVDSTIKETFPEISTGDYELYKAIYNYLINNKTSTTTCLMCGVTTLNPQLIEERLTTIKNIIENHEKLAKQPTFNKLITFSEQTFNGAFLLAIKKLLLKVDNNNIVSVALKINELFLSYDVKNIKTKYEDYLLEQIHDTLKDDFPFKLFNDNKNNLAELEKKNKQSLNLSIVEKFKENLKNMGFKYYADVKVTLNSAGLIDIAFTNIDLINLFRDVLSESEKTIISLSLFLAIAQGKDALIIIDDPVDSHDQKNKYYIVNHIYDFVVHNDVYLLLLTHDLSLSQLSSSIGNNLKPRNMLLTSNELVEIRGTSIYFTSFYNYISKVMDELRNWTTDTLPFVIPIAVLLRYEAKYQYLFHDEVNLSITPPCTTKDASIMLKREDIKTIGFNDVSNNIMHYNANVDAVKLISELKKSLKATFKGTVSNQFTKVNDTIDLLKTTIQALEDTNIYKEQTVTQFGKELIVILKGILLRVSVEKEMLGSLPRPPRQTLESTFNLYLSNPNKKDDLVVFYKKNKGILNDFSHLDNGIEVLFNYQENELSGLFKELGDILNPS